MIKTLIFDLGNVLIRFDHNRIAARLESFTESSRQKILAKVVSAELTHNYNLGNITTLEFLDAVKKDLNSNICPADLSKAWNSTFDIEPILSDRLLKRLSDRYRLLALSDTNELHFEFMKSTFRILENFDEFILSYEIGTTKPSIQIFERAVEKAGCSPGECFFIDDIETNVEGARSVGINSVQFLSPSGLENDLILRGLI